jgi:Flp pilus assembly protein TadG
MKRGNRGQVLVFVALAIFVLLGFAALGIDVGYMYTVRHELQRSADAGALAGASVFRETGLNSDDATARDLAIVRATDYATRDEVSRSRLNTVPGDVVFVSFPQETNKMRVQVDVQRTAPLFFARVLGWANKAIPATATAEAYGVCKKVRCVVPWGIPAPYTDSNGDNTYTSGEPVHWAENGSTGAPTAAWCDEHVGSYTEWNTTTHTSGAPSVRDQFLCQGSLQVLKIGIPGNQENPGNFLGLNLQPLLGPEGCPGYKDEPMGNAGADFYYWMIEHSCDCDLKLGIDEPIALDTEPGNMVKRTITATAPTNYYTDPYYTDPVKPYLPNSWVNDPSVPDSLMNSDPGSQWTSSTNSLGGEPSTGIESGRVVRIPIFDPRISFEGRSEITPLAYVGFWIQDVVYKTVTIDGKTKDLGTVVGRFVTVEGEGTYENEECGSTVLNIRLVK